MCSHLALKTNITVNICEDKQINGWLQPLVMWPSWQFMNECVWTGEQVIGEGEEPGEVRTEGSQSYILGCDLSDMTWMHVSDSNNKKGLNSCIKVVSIYPVVSSGTKRQELMPSHNSTFEPYAIWPFTKGSDSELWQVLLIRLMSASVTCSLMKCADHAQHHRSEPQLLAAHQSSRFVLRTRFLCLFFASDSCVSRDFAPRRGPSLTAVKWVH